MEVLAVPFDQNIHLIWVTDGYVVQDIFLPRLVR
jgi:hypothetical protein